MSDELERKGGIRVILDQDPTMPDESVVDTDIAEFEVFFREKGLGAALMKPEVAIIKTYLWWKLHL
jgi:hypothetical protein